MDLVIFWFDWYELGEIWLNYFRFVLFVCFFSKGFYNFWSDQSLLSPYCPFFIAVNECRLGWFFPANWWHTFVKFSHCNRVWIIFRIFFGFLFLLSLVLLVNVSLCSMDYHIWMDVKQNLPNQTIMKFYYLPFCFIQFKEFELYWGAVFFRKPVHTFSWFSKSNWSDYFGHAKTGSGANTLVVLRRELFCSNFKVEWKTVFESAFSLVVFCSHAAFWHLCLLFLVFWSDFVLIDFPNPFIVRSTSCFLVNENSSNCVRTCHATFFSSSKIFVTNIWRHNHLKPAFCSCHFN